MPNQEERLDEPQVDEAAYDAAIDDFKELLNDNYGDSGGLTRIEIDGFRVVLYWNDHNWYLLPEELQLEITKLSLLAWVGLLRDHQVTLQSRLPLSVIDATKIEIRSLIIPEAVFAAGGALLAAQLQFPLQDEVVVVCDDSVVVV
ncbi:MAG: hypothetical protein O7G29_04765 [Acidobacteria bacterium]|nr:hypothetical protein [Acidobacteriota bacterium]